MIFHLSIWYYFSDHSSLFNVLALHSVYGYWILVVGCSKISDFEEMVQFVLACHKLNGLLSRKKLTYKLQDLYKNKFENSVKIEHKMTTEFTLEIIIKILYEFGTGKLGRFSECWNSFVIYQRIMYLKVMPKIFQDSINLFTRK